MAVVSVMQHLVHLLVERSVESPDDIVPDEIAVRDLVELLLDVGCEVVPHDVGEILLKVVGHYHSDLLREQPAPFGADGLRLGFFGNIPVPELQVIDCDFLAFLVTLDDVAASGGQSGDGRCVGGRTADAELLKLLDQSGL